jgi:hypothetical protein
MSNGLGSQRSEIEIPVFLSLIRALCENQGLVLSWLAQRKSNILPSRRLHSHREVGPFGDMDI